MIAEARVHHAGIQPPASDPVLHAAVLAALALYLEGESRPISSPWAAAARAGHEGAGRPWQTGPDAWARAERPR